MMEPEPMVTAPFMVKVWPADPVPAWSIAPLEAIKTEPLMVPVPPRMLPLLFTVVALPEASDPFTSNVPELTVVAPVYVLTPESVQVPEPLLVSEPVVVPIILETLPLPEPVRVSPNVAPVIVPVLVKFSVPLSEEIVVAAPRARRPA